MKIKCKFYMAEFKHKKTKKALIKFGITKHMDALERFSIQESIQFGRSATQYEDFDIKIILSIPCFTFNEAYNIEQEMLNDFYPKENFIVERFLNEPLNKYDNMSGVTELRYLTRDERKFCRQYLNNEYVTNKMRLYKNKKREQYAKTN